MTFDATYGNGGDVREIGCDARSIDYIIERELVDQWAGLQQKGEWLGEAISALM